MMNRRMFLCGLTLGTLSVPLVAAQQAGKIPVVALVGTTTPVSEIVGRDPISPAARAFVYGLRDLGWAEGRNLVIKPRSAEGQHERLPAIFADLVARNVDVIVVSGRIGRIWLAQEAQRVRLERNVVSVRPVVVPRADVEPDPLGRDLRLHRLARR